MMTTTPDNTGGGWCIHGVPYGPDWYCAPCRTPAASRAAIVIEASEPPNPWTEERVAKVIRLLESMEYHVRTKR